MFKIHTMEISEGKERQKETEEISKIIITEIFQKLIIDGKPQIQEAQRTQNENAKKCTPTTQWLRIHLPVQGTRVQALVQEDPTCHGATKPVHHNY